MGQAQPRVSCVVQAGGSSSRMGFDKAMARVGGVTLVERVLGRLAPVASELVVTAGEDPARLAFLSGARVGGMPVRLEADLPGSAGAMRGIASSLAAARGPLVCVVACDMPFVSAPLIERLAREVEGRGADVCVPRTDRGLEPLCAVWRRDACLPAARRLLAEGSQRIRFLLDAVDTFYLGEDEVRAVAGDLACFENANI